MIASGNLPAVSFAQACLAEISDLRTEGHSAFLYIDTEGAPVDAQAVDDGTANTCPDRLAGHTNLVKDLFNIKGQVATAGSIRITAALCGLVGLRPSQGRTCNGVASRSV
jgi:Asp-tRNA(Asn)/Glu-tRNA(Gln) amidotransferase A subunit family amidase